MANRRGLYGYTRVHRAVVNCNPRKLEKILTETDNDGLNSTVHCGYTPLHLAASSGHEECVRILLEHGADITIEDDFGKTPKKIASLSSKSTIVRLLHNEGEK